MEVKSLGIQIIKMIKIMLEEQCGVGYFFSSISILN
jgi:hypothetical protein